MNNKGVYIINNEEILNILLEEGKFPKDQVFYTENPAIIERFQKKNGQVKSLTFLSSSYLKDLDQIVLKIATHWQQTINRFCHEKAKSTIKVGDTFSMLNFRFLSVMIYRAAQLNQLIHEEGKVILPYVERNESIEKPIFDRLYSPHSDFFELLAKTEAYQERIQTIPFEPRTTKKTKYYTLNKSIHPKFWKDYLLAFSVMPERILPRLVKLMLPNSSSSKAFGDKNRKALTVLLYHSNTMLESAMIPMLLNGIKLIGFSEPKFKLSEKGNDYTFFTSLHKELNIVSNEIIKESSTDIKELILVIEILSKRIAQYVSLYLIPLQQMIEPHISNWIKTKCHSPMVMLSNDDLNEPISSMVAQSFSNNGIPVIPFQHGVRGITKLHRAHALLNDFRGFNDGFVGYSPNEESLYARRTGDTTKHVFVRGHTHTTQGRFPKLARILSRSLIGVSQKERLIIYASTLFRNNVVRLNHEYFDIPYWEFMKKLVMDVFGKTTIKTLIKTHRKGLLPSDDYRGHPLNEIELPPNVLLRSDPDMRHLRFAADVLILDWPSSVLTWLIVANIPLIYLSMGDNFLEDGIDPLLRKAIFVIDANTLGWENELLSILNLPQGELNKIWEQKKKDRIYFNENYYSGPKQSDIKMIEWIKNKASHSTPRQTKLYGSVLT